MVEIKVDLAHKSNYGTKRKTSAIKYIVVHYTANDGDTDENNGNYFQNNVVKTSAHYFVDDDSITQSVPDDYNAYHCGTTKKYKHPTCRNSNSIGVEICDDVKNGVIYPSAKTIANTLELVRHLMKKYNIPVANVIRHYDVTGKLCPAYWAGTAEKDKKWKTEFWDKLGAKATPAPKADKNGVDYAAARSETYNNKVYTVAASALNMRAGAGTGKKVLRVLKRGERLECYGYYTKVGADVWLYVKDKFGTVGFVSKKYLK